MTNVEQRRLRRSATLHGIAVVVFGLLAWSGARSAAQGLYGLAVPSIVAGIAGGVGAAVIAVTMWRGRGEAPGAPGETGADVRDGADVRMDSFVDGAVATQRSEATQRITRLAMAAAAVLVLVAGVWLAPQGMDRGFVMSVAGVLAAALTLFAMLAGDRPRTVKRPPAPARSIP